MDKLYSEAKENLFDHPTFETYFENEAKGRSSYDKTHDIDQERQEEEEEYQRILEDVQDNDSYRRELLARMFGGKLTSRQYGVLIGQT